MGLVQAGSARWEGCDCKGQVVPASVFPPVRCGSLAVLLSSVSWRPPRRALQFCGEMAGETACGQADGGPWRDEGKPGQRCAVAYAMELVIRKLLQWRSPASHLHVVRSCLPPLWAACLGAGGSRGTKERTELRLNLSPGARPQGDGAPVAVLETHCVLARTFPVGPVVLRIRLVCILGFCSFFCKIFFLFKKVLIHYSCCWIF